MAQASIIPVDPAGIPETLRRRPQWVLWRLELRPSKNKEPQYCKPPYQTNGSKAAVDDPATWSNFDTVLTAYRTGGYHGIGFVLVKDGGLVGIDLDDCRDLDTGQLEPRAAQTVRRFATYSELSPSGTGLRLFAAGQLPPDAGGKRDDVEVYDRSHFFTITGHQLPGTPPDIRSRQSELILFCREIFGNLGSQSGPSCSGSESSSAASDSPQEPVTVGTEQTDDNLLIARAMQAKNGDKFRRLWQGDTQGYASHSEADLALVAMLVFWTGGDRSRIDRLFRRSGLFDEKWDERHYAGGQTYGEHTLAFAIESHQVHAASGPSESGPVRENEPKPTKELVLTRLADVQAQPVSWLWPNHIPLGRITLLVGRAGVGKSFLTLDWAARVSNGICWPDGSSCCKGGVIIVSAEDDVGQVIRPRLNSLGADCQKIFLVSAVRRSTKAKENQVEGMFMLRDIDALDAALKAVDNCRLLILDPVGAFLGSRTDSYRDNEVRGLLGPLARLTSQYSTAVVIVAHRRKTLAVHADDMTLGSQGFVGVARAVWHVNHDKNNKARRLLLPGKNNLAADNGGLAFTIGGDPARIVWEPGRVAMTADDALALEDQAPKGRPGPVPHALTAAVAWLGNRLTEGPVEVARIKAEANAIGQAWRTTQRAADAMNVLREQDRASGTWHWRLPPRDQPGAKSNGCPPAPP